MPTYKELIAQRDALAVEETFGQFFRQLDGGETRQQGIDGRQQAQRRGMRRQLVERITRPAPDILTRTLLPYPGHQRQYRR